MDGLIRYLKQIVEPTVEEFKQNPHSMRHAFLACVATYHAIDRASYPKSSGNLRKKWGRQSMAFRLVDIVAHDFKHVRSGDRRGVLNKIPVDAALYGRAALNTHALNDFGRNAQLRNLTFEVQDALAFIFRQAGQQ